MRDRPAKAAWAAAKGDEGIDGGVFCETKPDEFGDEVTTGVESFDECGESAWRLSNVSGDRERMQSASEKNRTRYFGTFHPFFSQVQIVY